MYNESRLVELVRQKALKFGQFTLASGQQADYYLDCRKLTLDPEAANIIGHGMLDRIADLNPRPVAVGGMAIGADPITGAVVTISWQRDTPVSGFIVRKEPKAHGTGQMVEGPVEAGQEVVIVEDVTTTGGSSLKAVEHCRDFGLIVKRVVSIVDRQQGAADIFAAAGVEFQSLLDLKKLGIDQ